jgi:hypothetical protein
LLNHNKEMNQNINCFLFNGFHVTMAILVDENHPIRYFNSGSINMAKQINIDLDDVRRLAALQCTEAEAGAFFKITGKKFKKIMADFEEVQDAWEEGKSLGKTSLRRKQFRLASTSASMAIHLGKNMLDQRDVSTTELTGRGGGAIEVMDMDLGKLDGDARKQLRELLLRASRSTSNS